MEFFVDGHATGVKPLKVKEGGDDDKQLFEQVIELPEGEHSVLVRATSRSGSSAEEHVRLTIDAGKPTKSPVSGRLFVLSVGISEYRNPQLKLGFAHKDANDFTALWQGLEGKTFEQVVTKVLVNDQATVANIKEEGFQWLLNESFTPQDTVIIFLAGHGCFDKFDEWYFGGHELDGSRLSTTAISDAEFDSVLSKIPVNLILFTDTCHSGGFSQTLPIRSQPTSGANVWRGKGHVVFASCLPEEVSFESPKWNNGAFSRSILDYFADPKGDYNQDGKRSFTEMVLFVQTRVRALTSEKQNPTVEMPSSLSDIVFVR